MYAPPPEQHESTAATYWHYFVSCVGFILRLCCCVNQEDGLSLGEGHGSRVNLLDSRERRLLSSNESAIETTFTPPRSPELEHRPATKGVSAGGSGQHAQQQQQRAAAVAAAAAAGGQPGGSHKRSGSGGSEGGNGGGGGSPVKGGLKGKSQSALSLLDDDEICPTCLEPYTEDNPKVQTKCGHHYHLPCIYEWLERSETCPMCGREMHFEEVL